MQKDPLKETCFCIFRHVPFIRGNEGGEDGSELMSQMLAESYFYPAIPEKIKKNLLRVIISLHTFTSLALETKKLDFLSWSNTKIAIQTIELEDKSLLFFLLRELPIYSDESISIALDYIKKGIYFVLGEKKMSSIEAIKTYLEAEGERIFTSILPILEPNPINFSFSDVPNIQWHRAGVTASLILLMLIQTHKDIWGISCYIGNLLLASHIPLEIVKLFKFVPEQETETTVYLTSSDRGALTSHKNCIADIPEKEEIEANLIKVQYECVVFYLLTTPDLKQEINDEVQEKINKSVPEILSGIAEKTTTTYHSNAIVYNKALNILRSGNATEEFQKNAINSHDKFNKNKNLRDIIMQNSKEFTICLNILNVEHYIAIKNQIKQSFEEMYEEALKVNPDLVKFLHTLRYTQDST